MGATLLHIATAIEIPQKCIALRWQITTIVGMDAKDQIIEELRQFIEAQRARDRRTQAETGQGDEGLVEFVEAALERYREAAEQEQEASSRQAAEAEARRAARAQAAGAEDAAAGTG